MLAGERVDTGSSPFRPSFLSKSCVGFFWTLPCDFAHSPPPFPPVPTMYETLDWLPALPIWMQSHSVGDIVALGVYSPLVSPLSGIAVPLRKQLGVWFNKSNKRNTEHFFYVLLSPLHPTKYNASETCLFWLKRESIEAQFESINSAVWHLALLSRQVFAFLSVGAHVWGDCVSYVI